MRSLSPTDPRDPSGGLRATTNPAAESLQMSYCLVNEEDIDTPAEQQRHPRRYKSPHRSKRSPAPSHAKLQPSSQKHPECPAADPSLPKTNPEAQALRRESSQTVTPGSSSLAAPHSPLLTRPSPAMTPSLPDDSISDISYSPSRHDSPVASFSELPLSRVPSVPEFNGVSDSSAPFPDSSEQELVMPVLTVPHRRPFTETGKSIGSLKILVAGRKGTLPHPPLCILAYRGLTNRQEQASPRLYGRSYNAANTLCTWSPRRTRRPQKVEFTVATVTRMLGSPESPKSMPAQCPGRHGGVPATARTPAGSKILTLSTLY